MVDVLTHRETESEPTSWRGGGARVVLHLTWSRFRKLTRKAAQVAEAESGA